MSSNIKIYNEDCLQAMKGMADKQFDLAIVDPPYGIGIDKALAANKGKQGYKLHKESDWDFAIPQKEYWCELVRVSKNQIVWGGNYFTEYLPASMGWIVWNKMQREFTMADGELAWTSFNKALRIFDYARGNENGFAPKLKGVERAGINIHPTQKPIKLYEWLLMNYAKEGNLILDTHLGSGSIAIACYKAGYDLTAYEVDKDYYEAACKRLEIYKTQLTLW